MHDGPRERLHTFGPGALSDTELVAVQLSTGAAGMGALELAARLLTEWGGLKGLGRAAMDELARTPGVGPAKASRLVASFALADRIVAPEIGAPVRNSGDIASIAASRIGRSRVEEVLLVILDGSHRVKRSLVVARGGAVDCTVPVREILSLVLRHDGVALAIAHNHPSGVLEPSFADLAVTERLRLAADQLGLRFLDHVIVSRERWRGLVAPQN
ncbi:JAB domain-containing protein [Marmoricola sp. RAF53]|uniref:JAB domain-containing protein n=1 Tax=Marmoricola sp. RAF53 TaxID=3233059 RepID=UPI003F94FCEE